jgi:hypothetical protein
LALLALSGAGKSFVDVAGRTLMQRTVRSDVLARIFGLQEGLIMGGSAVGAAVAPLLVIWFGAQGAFVAVGVFLPTVGLLAWLRIRPLDDVALQPGPGYPLLAAIPMFGVLEQPLLERLSRDLVPATASAGSDVIVEGAPGDLFYVLVSGGASVRKQGQEVNRLGAGDFFGEVALLRDAPRNATVHALTDVELYTLERDVFLAAVTRSPLASSEASRVADERSDEPGS